MDTSGFLERLRQTVTLPTVSENWGDEAVLAEATEALRTRFAVEVVDTGSGYWRHQQVVNTVLGQNEYRIPSRAIVQGLQKLEVSRDSGQTWQLMNIVTLGSDGLYESTRTGTPSHFSHYGDYIRVFPTPADSTTKLRMSFYLSPSKLIATTDPTDLGRVVSKAGLTATVSGDVTTFLDSPGGLADFVNTTGCNEVALFDVMIDSIVPIGGGQWTIVFVAGTDLTRVAVGQVVRAADTTDQIPLPRELQNSLAAYTGALILVATGDTALGEKQAQKVSGDIRRIVDLAVPRDKAHPQKFKPRSSYLRRNAGRNWR